MRRFFSVVTAVGLVGGLWLVAPGGHAGAVPVDPSTTIDPSSTVDAGTIEPGTTDSTTTTIATATRGSTIQVTPTEPPPTTTTTTTTTTVPRPPSVGNAPANSGTGRRVVYSKGQMRVWLVDGNNNVVRTYRVSGRLSQPAYGTYAVFSRSTYTCNINHPNVCMRWMVRFAHGPSGDNIGFHEIPRNNGIPVQSESQLGQALSSGCVRQGTADAWFMWNWASIGTRVVVIR